MRKYIQNLVRCLIKANKYDEVALRLRHRFEHVEETIQHIQLDLEAHDVAKMNGETLGRIMGNLELGDVLTSKKELFGPLKFSGKCDDLLRQLVARCLAHVIYQQLGYSGMNSVPCYGYRTRQVYAKMSIPRLEEVWKFTERTRLERLWSDEPREQAMNLMRYDGRFDEFAQKFEKHFGVSRDELETCIILSECCWHIDDGDQLNDPSFPKMDFLADQLGVSADDLRQWMNQMIQNR